MRWTKLVAVAVVPVGIGVLAGWQITRHTPPPNPEAVAESPREEPAKVEPPKADVPKPPPVTAPLLPLPPLPPAPVGSAVIPPLPPLHLEPKPPVTPVAFAPPAGNPPPVVPAVSPPAHLIPPPAVTVPSVPAMPKLTPLTATGDGAPVSYVNARRVAVDYEVTKKGASGLGTVELWLKDANGWSRGTTAVANQRLEVELPADGVYGAKVVPVSGQGVRGPEPAKDAAPDVWIVRDTTPPHAAVKVAPSGGADGKNAPPFVVEVIVKDANLDADTLVINGAGVDAQTTPLFTAQDLSKERIETKLGVFIPRKNDVLPPHPADLRVVLDWTPVGDVPPRVNLGVAVKDRAGNAHTVFQTNIGTDLTEPAARVTGVRGLPGR